MHSEPDTKILRFAARKEFIHKATKQGDGRTSLRSASLKVRGWRYLWGKEAGWSRVWKKVLGGREKVRLSVFHAGVLGLHASSW